MDDLISRRAVRDALCDNCDNVQAVCPHYLCKQYTAIEALPSIDAIELGVEYSTIQFQVNLMADAEDYGDYRILNQRFVVERG